MMYCFVDTKMLCHGVQIKTLTLGTCLISMGFIIWQTLDSKLLKGILTEILYLVRFEDTLRYCGVIGDKTVMFN